MPRPNTSGATVASRAVKVAPDRFSKPYVHTNALDKPISGNITWFTERKPTANMTTTTTNATRINNSRLSNVPSSMSWASRSLDTTA